MKATAGEALAELYSPGQLILNRDTIHTALLVMAQVEAMITIMNTMPPATPKQHGYDECVKHLQRIMLR